MVDGKKPSLNFNFFMPCIWHSIQCIPLLFWCHTKTCTLSTQANSRCNGTNFSTLRYFQRHFHFSHQLTIGLDSIHSVAKIHCWRDHCLWRLTGFLFVFVIQWMNYTLPSVLWCCWLGGRKGIRPVKNRVVGCWRGYLSAARCRLAYGPADVTATHCLLLQ